MDPNEALVLKWVPAWREPGGFLFFFVLRPLGHHPSQAFSDLHVFFFFSPHKALLRVKSFSPSPYEDISHWIEGSPQIWVDLI